MRFRATFLRVALARRFPPGEAAIGYQLNVK